MIFFNCFRSPDTSESDLTYKSKKGTKYNLVVVDPELFWERLGCFNKLCVCRCACYTDFSPVTSQGSFLDFLSFTISHCSEAPYSIWYDWLQISHSLSLRIILTLSCLPWCGTASTLQPQIVSVLASRPCLQTRLSHCKGWFWITKGAAGKSSYD